MLEQNTRIAVTGANGYLGSRLCTHFKKRSFEVFQLTGNPDKADTAMPSARFAFADGVAMGFFRENEIDALVHPAYDFRAVSHDDIWRGNVKGSIALFEQAYEEGVSRIIFISTMSAYEGCRSLYGKAKLEIEGALREMGLGYSVRPGLIYSTPLAESGGIVGSMLEQVKRGSILPLIDGGRQELYLTHEEDLSRFIERLLAQPDDEFDSEVRNKGYFIAANRQPYTFRKIIEFLSEAASGKRIKFLPVPWRAVWLGLKALETFHVNTGFRSDSVLSLAYQDKQPDFSTLPRDFVFRNFAEAIQSEHD
jgi:nucleoside-diphosphate-sugar epimerase